MAFILVAAMKTFIHESHCIDGQRRKLTFSVKHETVACGFALVFFFLFCFCFCMSPLHVVIE